MLTKTLFLLPLLLLAALSLAAHGKPALRAPGSSSDLATGALVDSLRAALGDAKEDIRILPPILSANLRAVRVDDDPPPAQSPDCLTTYAPSNTVCDNADRNARCIAMGNSQCKTDISGWTHHNDGDPTTPGWVADGCHCVWQ